MGGCPGAAFKVVGRGGAAKGHIHMSMGVDAAWYDQESLCVDNLVSFHFERFAY
ncbi:MAG: hypothetical protein BWY75_03561 [bacterium ADurb.Bin425]|nr:MAG: hypothetical protein BWY75_03561 [bacterium ADurb.Bin425]